MMRISSVIIVVAFMGACSGGSIQSKEPPQASSTASPAGEQIVSLSGCLIGGETPVGTVGPSARPPVATTKTADEAQALRGDDSSAANRFMLKAARPASGETRGVGTNGAGGSGGPIVNGISDYTIEGNAGQLRELVNHQVIVTGKINSRSAGLTRTLVVDSIETVSSSCAQQ